MSKVIKNGQSPSDVVVKDINSLADEVIYSPTPSMRKLKAKFWSRFTPGPLQPLESITSADIQEVTQDSKVLSNWSKPGFKEWFMNRDENRERLEYLFSISLDAAEDILTNPDAQASAKVNMIKVLGELANKFPNRWQQEKFTDDEINKMNQAQLRTWLERKGIAIQALEPANTIEAGEYHITTPKRES